MMGPSAQASGTADDIGIPEFFNNRTALVTGATGFLGGILVEKLLRSCPGLTRVYLIIRRRNGQTVEARLARILSLPLFSQVSDEQKAKVTALEGDVSEVDAGLSPEDRDRVLREVEIVFHVAAYINFNAGLQRAVRINVRGSWRLLDMAKRMSKIKVFVYTSTAYCNCTQEDVVVEKIYPSRLEPQDVIEYVESQQPEKIAEQQPNILRNHPNAYVFTKLLAENMISANRGDVPVAIVRPAIVMGTLKEPMPGWVDNVNNGITAFVAGAGRGVFRTIHGDGFKVADLVPADGFASLVIAAAWDVAKTGGLKVYHHSSGGDNPITWFDYCRLIMKGVAKYPNTGLVFFPRARLRYSKLRNYIHALFAHYLPAFVLDLVISLMGDKPMLMDIQSRYFKGMQYTSFFTCREWLFDKRNTDDLSSRLSPDDKEKFDFETKHIDWPSYMETCVLGVRRFYHKEPDKNLHVARAIHWLWRIVDTAYHLILFGALVVFLTPHTGSLFISVFLAAAIVWLYFWF